MANQPKFSVAIRSDAYQNLINNTLGDKEVARQFVADITTVVSNNSALQACDAGSILSAGLLAQSLKLPLAPSLGFAYLVPYGNKAQFQVGWKGLVQLSQRSGQFSSISTSVVREGEYKGRDRRTGEPMVEFDLYADLKKPVIGYLAYFSLVNGFEKTFFMTKEEVEQHARKYSKAVNSGPWKDNFDLMAQKTVLKLLLNRYAPLNTELGKAIQADQAVIKEDGSYEYVDRAEDEPAEPKKTTIDTEVFVEERPTRSPNLLIPEEDDDDQPF